MIKRNFQKMNEFCDLSCTISIDNNYRILYSFLIFLKLIILTFIEEIKRNILTI